MLVLLAPEGHWCVPYPLLHFSLNAQNQNTLRIRCYVCRAMYITTSPIQIDLPEIYLLRRSMYNMRIFNSRLCILLDYASN